MKIFRTNQKYFATFGICRHQAIQRQSFNGKKLLPSFMCCLSLFSYGGFLICEANNFEDYIVSIYLTSAAIAITIIFLSFIWNKDDFFNFVDGWEKCIEQS